MADETNVTIFAAFIAGALSFLSPCVLPMIPAYLSFISGISVEELRKSSVAGAARIHLLLNAIFFISGFSVVFISLGLFASSLSSWVNVLRVAVVKNIATGDLAIRFLARPFTAEEMERYEQVFRLGILQLGGLLIIVFGLHMLGIIRIPLLYRESRVQFGRQSVRYLSSAIAGATFSMGWTPCVGPILSAILMVAASSETPTRGFVLLTAYSLGLGIPFFLSAVLVNSLFRWLKLGSRIFRGVEMTSGILLLLLGALLFFDQLSRLNTYFDFITRWLDLTGVEQKILQ
ncbi:MAG: cytochrome c biogenesis CcdA family protein [bacterium JZ-2024 1]